MSPRVFISYSHDSPAHKRWVAELGTFLRERGVDAILDQWDLSAGDDITKFMEQGLRDADRVLVICTDEYIRKAEGGMGGVAYERMIVTAELVKDLGTKKFVPVIRAVVGHEKVPLFLGARLWIDLSDGCPDGEDNWVRLLKELHDVVRLEKPSLGPNPFQSHQQESDTSTPIQADVSSSPDRPEALYATATEVARRGDLMGWRQLSKHTRAPVELAVSSWRVKYEGHRPPDLQTMFAAVDEAVGAVAPLLVVALAGVESGLPKLVDQRALLDDLLNLGAWPHSGREVLADIRWTLGFVYHGLHGALAVSLDEIHTAFTFADMQVRNPLSGDSGPLVQHGRLVGWAPSLGGNVKDAWEFLASAADRWPWIVPIFGSAVSYREALTAYFMLLSLDEFARTASTPSGLGLLRDPQSATLEVPIAFVAEEREVAQEAVRRVRRLLPLMRARWTIQERPVRELSELWSGWVTVCTAWLRGVYRGRQMYLPHADLM